MDRVHHEAGLHAHHRAVARVDPLHLARDQAVSDIGCADAAIFLGYGWPEQAERPHFAEDFRIGMFVGESLDDARRELFLGIGTRSIAHHPLILGQLFVEEKGIRPIERAHAGHNLLHLKAGPPRSRSPAARFAPILE